MKTNILLIAGILTLGLVACNKDENLQPAGEQGQESLKGAYMQIQVVGPTTGIGTKTTPGEDGTEEGTAEENAFTNVRIILKPTGENTAAPQSFLINGSELIAVDVDADETVTGYATPRIEVAAAGTYEVFVIANDKSSSVWTTLTSAPSSAVI